MSDLSDKAHQLNILWKSGRDKYVSFFAVLGQVRAEIGSDALNQWCISNLRMHINTIVRILDLLHDTDAQREKLVLRDAVEAKRKADGEERARRAAERQRQHEARQAEQAEKQAQREAAGKEKERRKRNETAKRYYHARKQQAIASHNQQKIVAAVEAVENPRIKILLAECNEIEKTSRFELGRRYAELQELVQSGQVGKNPATGKLWAWNSWAEQHIQRDRSDIYKCIMEFVALCNNEHNGGVDTNIVPIRR